MKYLRIALFEFFLEFMIAIDHLLNFYITEELFLAYACPK